MAKVESADREEVTMEHVAKQANRWTPFWYAVYLLLRIPENWARNKWGQF